MATTNKDLDQPALNSTNWDVPLNANFGVIDAALGGNTTKSVTGVGTTPVVLTTAEYQKLVLTFSGTLTANVNYRIPSGVGGQWIVRNGTSGSFTLTISSGGGGTSVVITQGTVRTVYSDGTNIRLTDQVGANIPDTYIVYSDGTSLVGSQNVTYDGANLDVRRETSTGDSVTIALGLHRATSVTAAPGIGPSLAFYAENSAGTDVYGAAIAGVATDVTPASEDFKLQFRVSVNGATPAPVAEVSNTGITFKDDLVITGRAATGTAVQDLEYAGIVTTADDDGTKSSGTYTPDPAGGNMKRIVNGGAFTLAAPSAAGDYTLVIQITNNASAGAITLSGFNRTSGSPFTTTNGHDFFVYITKCNGFTFANVVALQ